MLLPRQPNVSVYYWDYTEIVTKSEKDRVSFVQTTSSMERMIEEFIPALWREISYKDVNQIVASPQSIGGLDRFRKIKYDIG